MADDKQKIYTSSKKSSSSVPLIIGFLLFATLIPTLKPKLEKFLNAPETTKNIEKFSWIYENDFFTSEVLSKLDQVMRTINISIIADDTGIEGAGEVVPVGHQDCKHPFMTLNANRTFCSFPHRLDIALHYLNTGGFGGAKDTHERMASRLYSFRHKLMRVINQDQLVEMYGEKFINKAKYLCTKNNSTKYSLDKLSTEIFMFDVIIILPGQELPMHIDIPYFWGADRKSLPHWLLAVMKQSGLFDSLFIPQIQGVAWLSKHQYNKNDDESKYNGGNFYFFPYKNDKEQYELVKALYNAAILVDGTQVVHGVERYKAKEPVPQFDKNNRYYFRFDNETDLWNLYDYTDNLMRTYKHDDIRISLVWRVHCFEDQNEMKKYHEQKPEDRISIDEIVKLFKDDLKRKGKLNNDNIRPLDLWTLVVQEYSRYPISLNTPAKN